MTVKVVVVPVPGGEPITSADVVARCRERLASYKRPRYVEFLCADELPRSTTGKLQRHLLAARGASDDQRVD